MTRQACAPYPDPGRPLYARMLRLRYLNLGGVQCFLLFEGTVVLGVLLALAELVPWWGVLAVPVSVAAMVKVNDLIAGTVAGCPRQGSGECGLPFRNGAACQNVAGRPGAAATRDKQQAWAARRPFDQGAVRPPVSADEATTLGLTHSLNVIHIADSAGSPQQRARQSAVRRYE